MNEHARTIEVSGQKFEVDMRTAKRIDSFKVGDRVKILVKDYSGYKAHPGAIVGIDAFKNLPTIVVAYIDNVFGSSGEVKFAYLNAHSDGVEICPMAEDDIVPTRETILTYFNQSIAKKEQEVAEIRTRKEYFLRQYGTAFGSVEAATTTA